MGIAFGYKNVNKGQTSAKGVIMAPLNHQLSIIKFILFSNFPYIKKDGNMTSNQISLTSESGPRYKASNQLFISTIKYLIYKMSSKVGHTQSVLCDFLRGCFLFQIVYAPISRVKAWTIS